MNHGQVDSSAAEKVQRVRLGGFIRGNSGQIVKEWTDFAGTLAPAGQGMTRLGLQDHVEQILGFIADDLESRQTAREQVEKSQGHGPKEGGGLKSAAEVHADLRLGDGFDVDRMNSEYRALRACVLKLWTAGSPDLDRIDVRDLIRFNEAIDQAVAESLKQFTATVDRSRNLFLGILTHDLRNPLGAILLSAQLSVELAAPGTRQAKVAARIEGYSSRAISVLDDLLDLTRLEFGSDLPIVRDAMDVAALSGQLVGEMRAAYPDHVIVLETSGNMEVEWDRLRIGQVLSNLIGNAVAHGSQGTPVTVSLAANPQTVTLSVHNEGVPIPPERVGDIFGALIRDGGERDEPGKSTHLGLGLYIATKIVMGHGGTIAVASSEEGGTRFDVCIPRRAA